MKKFDLSTEEKRNEVFELFKSFNKKGDIYGYLNTSDNCISISYVNEVAHIINFDFKYYNEKKITKKFCLKCGKELNNTQKKFCSKSCSAKYNNCLISDASKEKRNKSLIEFYKKVNLNNNKEHIKVDNNQKKCKQCNEAINNSNISSYYKTYKNEMRHEQYYKYFLNHPEAFNKPNYTPKRFKYDFIKEQQGYCAICGCEQIHNGKKLVFVLDHIDGDASNNKRENLRCICPNCDSQTDTFKSKNKNSTRRNYWKEKIINGLSK